MSEELKRANREKELKHKLDKSSLDGLKKEIAKLEKEKIDLTNEKDKIFKKFKEGFQQLDDQKTPRSNDTAQATPPVQQHITFGQSISTSSKQHAPQPQHQPQVIPIYNMPSERQKLLPQPQPSQIQLSHSLQKVPGNERQPVTIMQSNVMPPHSVASMVPTSLHHGLYGQVPPSQFFPQTLGLPPHSVAAAAAGGHGGHRINASGRQPTPTSNYNNMGQPHIKSTSSFNKAMPIPQHPLSSMSGSSGNQSSAQQFQLASERERHRLYKRSHDQAVSSAQPPPLPPTMPLPPPHIPYLQAGFKPIGPGFPPLPGNVK